ncbi:hypothetical protein [Vreelandella sp. GE22]
MKLEFENYDELLALHKSLMAVKFDPDSYLLEAQGSPYTASLAFKVFDLLVCFSRIDNGESQAQQWLAWQVADEKRLETQLLMRRVAEFSWWSEANADQRKGFVVDFMAPLKLQVDCLERIVHQV